MPVNAHDSSRQAFIFVLWEGDVFEGPNQNLSSFLLGEVVASK